jgi:hypothetical protein
MRAKMVKMTTSSDYTSSQGLEGWVRVEVRVRERPSRAEGARRQVQVGNCKSAPLDEGHAAYKVKVQVKVAAVVNVKSARLDEGHAAYKQPLKRRREDGRSPPASK